MATSCFRTPLLPPTSITFRSTWHPVVMILLNCENDSLTSPIRTYSLNLRITVPAVPAIAHLTCPSYPVSSVCGPDCQLMSGKNLRHTFWDCLNSTWESSTSAMNFSKPNCYLISPEPPISTSHREQLEHGRVTHFQRFRYVLRWYCLLCWTLANLIRLCGQ
jgi:hypothetical protein